MIEAKNFIEREMNTEWKIIETIETKPPTEIYTPPQQTQQTQQPIPHIEQIIQQPVIQIVEKVIYKKQRIHWFFRTLTLIALLIIGFLMLGESTWLLTLSIDYVTLNKIYPIAIILSTIIIWSYKGLFGKIFWLILFLSIFWGIFTIGVYTSLNPSTQREKGTDIVYTLPKTDNNKKNNIYIQTLIGNSYIEWDIQEKEIKWTRNSDRNLITTSWSNTKINYLKLNEDKNWNILQNFQSNINLTIPKTITTDLIYIKNYIWLHTIDLHKFSWDTLKIHWCINDITIKVANILSGNKIEIQGTAANVDIEIPNNVWVTLYYKHYVGKLELTNFEALSWHYFQSQNFNTAKKKMDIYINLWAGNTKINRVEPKK